MHSHVNIAPAVQKSDQNWGQDTSRGSPWFSTPEGFSWNRFSLFFPQRFTAGLALEADYRHRVESKCGSVCRARCHRSTAVTLDSERAALDSRFRSRLSNSRQLRFAHRVLMSTTWYTSTPKLLVAGITVGFKSDCPFNSFYIWQFLCNISCMWRWLLLTKWTCNCSVFILSMYIHNLGF